MNEFAHIYYLKSRGTLLGWHWTFIHFVGEDKGGYFIAKYISMSKMNQRENTKNQDKNVDQYVVYIFMFNPSFFVFFFVCYHNVSCSRRVILL